MAHRDHDLAKNRASTTSNGLSTLPEVDARKNEVSDGKELRPAEGKEAVFHGTEGLEVLPSSEKQRAPQPGIEVAGSEGKEAVQTYPYYGDAAISGDRDGVNHEDPNAGHRRRRRRAWIIGSIVLLLILGIALGVGLGVGLQGDTKEADSSQSASTSNATASSASSTSSTRGAFNGSGISMRRQGDLVNLTSGDVGTSDNDNHNLLLVFQHHTGDIRWMQRSAPDTWLGGSESESVTTWGRNATPLSILQTSWTEESKSEWHVFYVGKNNKLRQQTIDNKTFTWQPGPLDDLSIATLNADKRGLVSCYYSGPIDDPSYNASSGDAGIRLFVATSETTFEQVSWQPGMSSWVVEQQWTGLNGHAQPACNGWSAGSVTYAMFVDQNDQVAFYWRDHGSGNDNNPNHPMNEWVKASLNIPAVDPEAGLSYGYGGNLFARTSNNGPVLGWNITFDAENTAISGSSLSQVSGDPSIADSSLASWSIPPDVSDDDEYEVLVFYQTEGDDITVFSGDVDSGEWTSTKLPIPDD